MAINEQEIERYDGSTFICPNGLCRYVPLYDDGYRGEVDFPICLENCSLCDEHCR